MKDGGDADELLDRALELGVTAFDTARCYGKAEECLGKWMEKRGNRERVVVLTKGGINGFMWRSRIREGCLRKDLARSLENLRTGSVDIYLLHRDDARVPVGDIVQLMNEFVAERKICAYGGSNWTHERIEQANEYALVTLTGDKNAAARGWYEKTGMPVIAWSSLGNGIFSGRFRSDDVQGAKRSMNLFARTGWLYPENLGRLRRAEIVAQRRGMTVTDVAAAFVAGSRMNVFPVMSASSAKHLEADAAAISVRLTDEERGFLLYGDKGVNE